MTRRLLLALVLACLPSLALAAGPRDGSYRVEVAEVGPYQEPHIRYVVVIQNDSQIGFALLGAEGGPWRYGAGTISGDQAAGTLFVHDGTAYGTFNLTITGDGQLSGAIYEGSSYLYVAGARFF
jgi:hypothetical protein